MRRRRARFTARAAAGRPRASRASMPAGASTSASWRARRRTRAPRPSGRPSAPTSPTASARAVAMCGMRCCWRCGRGRTTRRKRSPNRSDATAAMFRGSRISLCVVTNCPTPRHRHRPRRQDVPNIEAEEASRGSCGPPARRQAAVAAEHGPGASCCCRAQSRGPDWRPAHVARKRLPVDAALFLCPLVVVGVRVVARSMAGDVGAARPPVHMPARQPASPATHERSYP